MTAVLTRSARSPYTEAPERPWLSHSRESRVHRLLQRGLDICPVFSYAGAALALGFCLLTAVFLTAAVIVLPLCILSGTL